ncbi:MAG: radical SAM protein [Candidatus Omnitrophica bacterium]|nr:radical SAM protein [Candidatus Omnitrophota bacterium]
MCDVPFPKTVDLALTGKCNLRCKHCNTSDTWNLDEELSFNDILDILKQLKNGKIFNLSLFGGEPFCYERIFDFLELLNSFPMSVSILTNGTLIDSTAVKYLKKMRFLKVIQVSIDGSCPKIHDWQRGTGSFEKATSAVKLLRKNTLPVILKAIINNNNYRDIENMVKMARELGLNGMHFGDAVECGRAAVYASDIHLEAETHKCIMEEMFRLKKKYPDFNFDGTLTQKMDMLREFYIKGPGNGSRGTFSTCGAAQSMLSIRSDGKVVPCSAFWTLECGDARKSSLQEIWDNSDVLNEIRKAATESLTNYGEKCEGCDYLSYCNGGCRAAAYYASDNDLRGIECADCFVFSSAYGYRLDKETVLN